MVECSCHYWDILSVVYSMASEKIVEGRQEHSVFHSKKLRETLYLNHCKLYVACMLHG
jgi:hypothetical protein